ncbi:hypothetical protein BpHYR1_039169 [Brachionus plicatilis]|uniref:WAP domain-containing protein n=1 Tax=Brachionus plicatilis TaxID=10195 RepID=A0A3M7QMY0_BRAPC|nr:hypothetical protein BpHYR1_039169 [Brachionus plicatilis]
MKYLVIVGLLAFLAEASAIFGTGFGLGMDYGPMLPAPMLPSPQFGPRFRFQKEIEPERQAPGRRPFFKEKPLPVCPVNLESEECASECGSDSDCDKLQICCKSGCSTACVDQDLSDAQRKKNDLEQEEEIQVTLECPKVDANLNCTEIKEICATDFDCDFDKKCCRVRCSMRCIGPRPEERKRRVEGRRNRQRGNDRMRSSRIDSLYPNSDNILLSNSKHIYPNSYLSQQGQFLPRFSMNFGN